MQINGYGSTGFYGASTAQSQNGGQPAANATKTGAQDEDAAVVISLSQAAQEAGAEPDFSAVISAAREALNQLLSDAGRESPLEDGKLALDMSSLGQRQLYAIASQEDGLFTPDERGAASLEIARRFDLALSGPAAVSEVAGDYRNLYKAAAAYFDGLSAEQKAEPEWQTARTAIDEALKALQTDRTAPPQGIENDPVAEWLAARAKEETPAEDTAVTLAQNLRNILDKRYDAAREAGRTPTLDRSRAGHFIDLAEFDSRAVSAMSLNRDGLFSPTEVHAANVEIRSRANAALSEGYKEAARSGDPTAFSRNIVAMYYSMSADERQAAGFTQNMLDTALSSYETTSRLMNMIGGSSGEGGSGGGLARWFAQ